jgi:hypothetical protein
MHLFNRSSKININNFIFSFFLLELFILILSKNYLSTSIIITHTIILLTLLIWFISNIDFSNVIKNCQILKIYYFSLLHSFFCILQI